MIRKEQISRKGILDLEDTAKILHKSHPAIYGYVRQGILIPFKKGNCEPLFFRRKELEKFREPKKGRPPKRKIEG